MTRTNPTVRRRLHALSLYEWAFVAAGLVGLALAGWSAVSAARGGSGVGAVALFGLFGVVCYLVVREAPRPEVNATCQECGRRLVVDSAMDSRDHAVTVQFSGPPTRRRVGPLSAIAERDRQRHVFCSPDCARLNVGPLKEEQEQASHRPTPEVAA